MKKWASIDFLWQEEMEEQQTPGHLFPPPYVSRSQSLSGLLTGVSPSPDASILLDGPSSSPGTSSGFRSDPNSDCGDEPVHEDLQKATERLDDLGLGQSLPLASSEAVTFRPKITKQEHVEEEEEQVVFLRKTNGGREAKKRLSRSSSAPMGIMPVSLYHMSGPEETKGVPGRTLPRVTISDFSALNLSLDSSEVISEAEAEQGTPYVTLEDVAIYKHGFPLTSKQRQLSKRRRNSITHQPNCSNPSLENLRNDDTWSYTNSSIGTGDTLDDISLFSEAETDAETCADRQKKKPSGWRKVRNMVQWTPFVQNFRNRKYQWVQLAGHSGNFKAGRSQGTVLKKLCPQEERCYTQFPTDTLGPFVPEYQGTLLLDDDDEKFIQLQDCLSAFQMPSIMDCKIGVRTYLEEELAKAKEKPKLRKDMYEKMMAVDRNAPSEEEHRLKGVTKPRYMVWRETISSTATLGFRIEGVKKNDGTSSKEFKTTKTKDQVLEAFRNFISSSHDTAKQYLDRLVAIRQALDQSQFFRSHELIGSSLLFVHDTGKACVWLIDFGKTVPLPPGLSIDHRSPWEVGNHEDGYLIGIQNLISIFSELVLQLDDKTTT